VTPETKSYWHDTAALPRFPRLDRDLTVDVIVVGAGITGVTAAYLCRKAGFTVALLERERCGGVDTGLTTAHLTCVTDERVQDLAKRFGDTGAKLVWDAGQAAIDEIVRLIRTEDISCDFAWVSAHLHAPVGEKTQSKVDEAVIKELKKENVAAGRLGIRATYEPVTAGLGVPGVRFAHQALFHPRRYLGGLLRGLPAKGSQVFEYSPVEEILEQPLTVKANGCKVRGGYLILATHNPLMGNTGMTTALLHQTKLSLYTSYALGARMPTGTLPPALYWDTSDPYYYLRVEQRRGFDYAIFGGEDHKTGQCEDTELPYRRLEQKFLQMVPEAQIHHDWSGQVIETIDGLPYIGETAERQFAATGYAGNGMTFGTLAAMMALDALQKRKNPWAELFDVNRKKLGVAAWRFLKENKDYPYYLVRDWLAKAEGTSLRSLRPNQGKILNLDGRKVAAHRDEEGTVTLCSPVCPHLGGIVAWNKAEQTWDCPCHGSRFKPNGEVISGPAEEGLKPVKRGD
jgi:glycine/D-amino acid oxidase-like deaminating enzyme/nitrite reductase/ring-hydroxylating ferredoxin subunit